MKKLLLMFVGILCSLGMWAEDFGFSSTISSDNTVSAPIVTTHTNGVTVAIARGSKTQTGSGKSNMFWGSSTVLTFNGAAERTQYNPGTGNVALPTNAFVDDVWTGAKITIPEGKVLKATKIYIEAAGQDYKWHYKVSVVNGDGSVVNVPENKGGSSPKANSVLSVTESFTADLTGSVYVKVHFYNETSSNSKYFAIPVIKLTGTLEDAAAQTQYQKPSISQGAYDNVGGTYAVTLNAKDDDAVINYTVGDGEKVSGVASGTVINVAPNTKIVATASGSSYTESDEQTLTTTAAPKLAKPTYSIGAFSYDTNQYEVTINYPEGSHVWYRINTGDWTAYTSAFSAPVKATIEAQAKQNNMTASDVLNFEIPTVSAGGTAETPKTSGTYTDGMAYNAGAFTIPSTNSYIGGQISSGNSSINGAIKMRISRNADPAGSQDSKYGFHILVNPGNALSEVSLQMLNNYDTQIALTGVYVDNGTDNLLESPVALPYASANTVQPVVATVSGISATQKVVFVFEKTAGDANPNQAQILISSKYAPSVNLSMNLNSDGLATFSCAASVKISGAKVYTAVVNEDQTKLVCTEVEDGIVPAGNGVILAGDAGAEVVAVYAGTETSLGENVLQATTQADGSLAERPTDGSPVYALSGDAFKSYTPLQFVANKAYLGSDLGSSAKGLSIVFEDATAINNVAGSKAEVAVKKFFKNGQLLIQTAKGTVNAVGVQVK